MADLNPCPFCGDAMDSFAGMTPGAFATGSYGTYSVSCDCGAMGPSAKTMEEAIVAWNRRSTVIPAEIAGVVEKLQGWAVQHMEVVALGTEDQRFVPTETTTVLREAAALIERLAASQAETRRLAVEALEPFAYRDCVVAGQIRAPLVSDVRRARTALDRLNAMKGESDA